MKRKFLRGGKEDEALAAFVEQAKTLLRDLYDALHQSSVDFKTLLGLHIKTAEALAATPDKDGAQVLWKGEAGRPERLLLLICMLRPEFWGISAAGIIAGY